MVETFRLDMENTKEIKGKATPVIIRQAFGVDIMMT